MKKRRPQKLALHRETLRVINSTPLRRIHGGTDGLTDDPICSLECLEPSVREYRCDPTDAC